MIDPLADKLLTLGGAASPSCRWTWRPPGWSRSSSGREFAVTGLRSLAYARGVADSRLAARQAQDGREVVAILALILAHEESTLR